MASLSLPQHKVFINFRGIELRKRFVSYLGMALKKDGVNVYIDEMETRGEDLGSIFFRRIEESRIALVILSRRYPESRWCLDELVKIMECVDLGKLVAVPIFYNVETDDVGNLSGEFGDKFWELARTSENDGSIDRWRAALKAIPNKLGFTFTETSNEGELLGQIVAGVIKVLSTDSTQEGEETPGSATMVDIESRLKLVEEKLDLMGLSLTLIRSRI